MLYRRCAADHTNRALSSSSSSAAAAAAAAAAAGRRQGRRTGTLLLVTMLPLMFKTRSVSVYISLANKQLLTYELHLSSTSIVFVSACWFGFGQGLLKSISQLRFDCDTTTLRLKLNSSFGIAYANIVLPIKYAQKLFGWPISLALFYNVNAAKDMFLIAFSALSHS